MKNLLLLTLLSFLLQSCYQHRYAQVYKIDSVNPDTKPNLVENKDLKIEYDFWEDGGKLGMKITNKTESAIVIDFQNSYLLTNNNYQSLHNNDVTEVSKIYKKNKIYNQNISKELNNKRLNYSNGKLKYTVVTHTTKTPDKITLPPYASYNYSNIALLNDIYYSETFKFFNYNEKQNKVFNEVNFNNKNSPINFNNIVQYKFENDQTNYQIINNFFVSSILNIYEPKFIDPLFDETQTKLNTNNSFYKRYEIKNRKVSPSEKDDFNRIKTLNTVAFVLIFTVFFIVIVSLPLFN
jgi:hypothetical protein